MHACKGVPTLGFRSISIFHHMPFSHASVNVALYRLSLSHSWLSFSYHFSLHALLHTSENVAFYRLSLSPNETSIPGESKREWGDA